MSNGRPSFPNRGFSWALTWTKEATRRRKSILTSMSKREVCLGGCFSRDGAETAVVAGRRPTHNCRGGGCLCLTIGQPAFLRFRNVAKFLTVVTKVASIKCNRIPQNIQGVKKGA